MRAFQTWVGIVLMLMLATIIIFVKVVKDERTLCVKDPLIYGAKSIEENNKQPFMCECGFLAKDSPRFIVTKEGYNPIIDDNQNNYIPFNISILYGAIPNDQ